MRFLIVTGMSGAGISTALNTLEDSGFFCVDNLPVLMIEAFANISRDSHFTHDNVAIGIDIRNGAALEELRSVLEKLHEDKFHYEILFLEASDDALVRRYKETRREHPLARGKRLIDGISVERERVNFLKQLADYTIDTSNLLTRDLKLEVERVIRSAATYSNLIVNVMSFGYKFGIPRDADMVFDVRFLPNPYYVQELRKKTGNDKEVQDYVMQGEEGPAFLEKLADLVRFLLPQYVKEARHQLVVAIGCTGGRHRSVTVANALSEKLKELPYSVICYHRDIRNDSFVKGED